MMGDTHQQEEDEGDNFLNDESKPLIPREVSDQIRVEIMSKVNPSPLTSPSKSTKIFTIGDEASDDTTVNCKGDDREEKMNLTFGEIPRPSAEKTLVQDTRISSSTPSKGNEGDRSRNNSSSFAPNTSGSSSPGLNGPNTRNSPELLSRDNHVRRSVSSSHDITLVDYLYTEIRRGYDLGNDEQRYRERREKFYIFLRIPYQLEKFLSYGFLQCADAFLFVFTLLPIRFCLAIWFSVARSFKRIISETKSYPSSSSSSSLILQPAEVCDLLKGIIMIGAVFCMSYVDMSMLYHMIKSQSVIKLYIFFNMLEVGDKLFSSFGQDILDALFWTATESRDRKRDHLGVIPHLLMATGYVFLHTLLVLLQATTLNVAINSKNKALLAIMMSNNFVELKSMVFKKFEKNNLFHMSCSDVRERFHYLILLFVVIVQTLKEYHWSENYLYVLLFDSFCILFAEIIVDWLKHAFVTRFNEISPDVYADYSISLAYDLTSSKLKSAFSDHSDIVSRRMGFIPLPLGVLVYRVMSGSVASIFSVYGLTCFILGYLCLSSLKAWINILLLGLSCKQIDRHRSQVKTPLIRGCSSLPSSRHPSVENLFKTVNASGMASQSTPQTPTPSQSSSLADITAQAHLLQETLDSSMIMSDSQVSLLSMDLEGKNREQVLAKLLEKQKIKTEGNESEADSKGKKRKSILRQTTLPFSELTHRRRVSLQESQLNS